MIGSERSEIVDSCNAENIGRYVAPTRSEPVRAGVNAVVPTVIERHTLDFPERHWRRCEETRDKLQGILTFCSVDEYRLAVTLALYRNHAILHIRVHSDGLRGASTHEHVCM